MYWDGLDTDTKARLIRDGLRMGMRRWESVRDAYDAAEERRLAAGQDGTDDDGDVIIDDHRGQWAHPGEVTRIPSNEITMRGVPYPVVGVSDKGDTKVMEPGYDYVYDGSDVTEFPLFQYGGSLYGARLSAENAMAKRPFANTTVEAEKARLEEVRNLQETDKAAREAAHRKANKKLSDDLSGKNGFWRAMATSLTRSGDPLTSGSPSAIADDANRLEDVGLNDEANMLRALSTGIGAAGLAAYTAPYWMGPVVKTAGKGMDILGRPASNVVKGLEKIAPVSKKAKYAANAYDTFIDMYLTGKGVYDTFFDDNGIKKTVQKIKDDDSFGALKSVLGDVMALSGARGLWDKAKMPLPRNYFYNKEYLESGRWKKDYENVREAFLNQQSLYPEKFVMNRRGDIQLPTVENVETDVNWHGFLIPEGEINPLKWRWDYMFGKNRSKAYNEGLFSLNDIYINPLFKFSNPRKFRGTIGGHEPVHTFQRLYKPEHKLSEFTGDYDYYTANTKNKFYDLLKPFDRKKGEWEGSPDELQAELFKWKLNEKIPLNESFMNLSGRKKDKLIKEAAERFGIKKKEAEDILYSLSFEGYFKEGGKIRI